MPSLEPGESEDGPGLQQPPAPLHPDVEVGGPPHVGVSHILGLGVCINVGVTGVTLRGMPGGGLDR